MKVTVDRASPSTLAGIRRRRIGFLLGLTGLLALAVLASMALGTKPIPPDAIWSAVWAPTGTDDDVIVRQLRVPRTVLGVGAGIALGVAGALAQAHTRNPLAEPGLLGVSAGASLLVVLAISVFGVTSLLGYVWFAFAGALVASAIVFALGAASRDGPTPVTLALAGVAITALLQAITSSLVLTNVQTLDALRFWEVGSLAGRGVDVAVQVLPFLLIGLVLAAVNTPSLNLLAMGEDVAKALGVHLTRARWLGLAAITLLAGAATAACGPILFVGLVVPHVCRVFTGPDQRWLVPLSGLAGAVLLLAADVLGRLVVRPGELQVGIVLALVGAPFFVALVRRRRLVTL